MIPWHPWAIWAGINWLSSTWSTCLKTAGGIMIWSALSWMCFLVPPLGSLFCFLPIGFPSLDRLVIMVWSSLAKTTRILCKEALALRSAHGLGDSRTCWTAPCPIVCSNCVAHSWPRSGWTPWWTSSMSWSRVDFAPPNDRAVLTWQLASSRSQRCAWKRLRHWQAWCWLHGTSLSIAYWLGSIYWKIISQNQYLKIDFVINISNIFLILLNHQNQ